MTVIENALITDVIKRVFLIFVMIPKSAIIVVVSNAPPPVPPNRSAPEIALPPPPPVFWLYEPILGGGSQRSGILDHFPD